MLFDSPQVSINQWLWMAALRLKIVVSFLSGSERQGLAAAFVFCNTSISVFMEQSLGHCWVTVLNASQDLCWYSYQTLTVISAQCKWTARMFCLSDPGSTSAPRLMELRINKYLPWIFLFTLCPIYVTLNDPLINFMLKHKCNVPYTTLQLLLIILHLNSQI